MCLNILCSLWENKTSVSINVRIGSLGGWMNGKVDGRVDGRMDGWIDRHKQTGKKLQRERCLMLSKKENNEMCSITYLVLLGWPSFSFKNIVLLKISKAPRVPPIRNIIPRRKPTTKLNQDRARLIVSVQVSQIMEVLAVYLNRYLLNGGTDGWLRKIQSISIFEMRVNTEETHIKQ